MYDAVDFYELSTAEQRQLINNKRVATTSRLLREIPDNQPPVRVFEQSVEELILDRLERGRYTNAELAEEFSIQERDARAIVNKYRRRGTDNITNESFKYNLLTDRDGIIRVKAITGNTFHYMIEKIPYFARVVDPTLGVSLLNIHEQMREFPRLVDDVSAGTTTEIDETYAVLFGDFWGIDPQEIFDFITEFDREYIDTALMPFPVVDAGDEYDQVAARFEQHTDLYNWYRNPEKAIKTVGEDFMDVIERGNPGIRMYQLTHLEFTDLTAYAETTDPPLFRPINNWVETIVESLHPETEGTETHSGTETATTDTVSIDDEVLSVLGETFQTSDDVYDSLPAMVQAETTPDEVQESLDLLAKLGIITEKTQNGQLRYNAESGTVSRGSVL